MEAIAKNMKVYAIINPDDGELLDAYTDHQHARDCAAACGCEAVEMVPAANLQAQGETRQRIEDLENELAIAKHQLAVLPNLLESAQGAEAVEVIGRDGCDSVINKFFPEGTVLFTAPPAQAQDGDQAIDTAHLIELARDTADVLQRWGKDQGRPYVLQLGNRWRDAVARLESQVESEPVMYVSSQQIGKWESNYAPYRYKPDGLFTVPLYRTAPPAQAASEWDYTTAFNAIAAATKIEGKGISISVKAFEEAIGNATPPAQAARVPDGWKVEIGKEYNEVVLTAPDGSQEIYHDHPDDLSGQFVRAVINAAPATPQEQEGRDND